MMNEIRQRISKYLSIKGFSDYSFEKSMGLSKGYMNRCKNPSSDIIYKMCCIYTDISAEWLIRGTGSMLLTDQQPQSREGLIRMYQDLLEVRDNKIRELEMQLINLESQKMSV